MSVSLLSQDTFRGYDGTRSVQSKRTFGKAQIVIHKLLIITGLALLPLLAWHNATVYVFETRGMPPEWMHRLRTVGLTGLTKTLWVATWIFVPIDILHAVWALASYQELLNPRTGEDTGEISIYGRAAEHHSSHIWLEELPSRDLGQKPTPTIARRTVSTRCGSVRRALRDLFSRQFRTMKQASSDVNYISQTHHSLLRPSMPAVAQIVLLTLFDAFLVLILIAHSTTYRALVVRIEDFCDTKEVVSYPDSDLRAPDTLETALGFRVPSMSERCQRHTWNITAAGGFSSTIAAILAAIHVAAITCRITGMSYIWTTETKDRRKVKAEDESKGQENGWHVTPRDVDIHRRGTARSGRLTVISEEEYNSSGDAVRRRRGNKTESGISEATSGGSKNVEEALLECLVP